MATAQEQVPPPDKVGDDLPRPTSRIADVERRHASSHQVRRRQLQGRRAALCDQDRGLRARHKTDLGGHALTLVDRDRGLSAPFDDMAGGQPDAGGRN